MIKNRSENLNTSHRDATYTLGRTSHETTRLIQQSKIYGESTHRLCKRAGVIEGDALYLKSVAVPVMSHSRLLNSLDQQDRSLVWISMPTFSTPHTPTRS